MSCRELRVPWREDFNRGLNVGKGCNFQELLKYLLSAGDEILAHLLLHSYNACERGMLDAVRTTLIN